MITTFFEWYIVRSKWYICDFNSMKMDLLWLPNLIICIILFKSVLNKNHKS